MKKIVFKLLFVFAFILCINITSVYAESCSEKKTCTGLDDQKHFCASQGQFGCVAASSCEQVDVQYCNAAYDTSGNKCGVIDGTRCVKASEITYNPCEKRDQNSCEGFTSDFRYCKYRPVAGGGCQAVTCGEVSYLTHFSPLIS